jgi:hypothetical protein
MVNDEYEAWFLGRSFHKKVLQPSISNIMITYLGIYMTKNSLTPLIIVKHAVIIDNFKPCGF